MSDATGHDTVSRNVMLGGTPKSAVWKSDGKEGLLLKWICALHLATAGRQEFPSDFEFDPAIRNRHDYHQVTEE